MRHLKNEAGMSLMEVLAVLVIGTMFMMLAMTMIGLNMKSNAAQMAKTRLQQEANLITAELAEAHRQCPDMLLFKEGQALSIEGCDFKRGQVGGGNYTHHLHSEDILNRPLGDRETLTVTVMDGKAELTVPITLSRLGTLN
ncbi:PilW family protein [Bhargavaea ginsengi]|uniref:PilW family protein n=1 Tax=Bhargavaea ginsengi TaxID=426757 RepID=UPI003C71AB2E